MLLRHGLEQADNDGAKTYIEASPAGLPLYLKHGWEPVDEIIIDMRPHGDDKVHTEVCLIREPWAANKLR